MVGCSRCAYPSIHLFVSKSRSVVRGAVVCCVCMKVLCCVVVLRGVVWCGVYFSVFLCCFSLFLSFFFSLSFLLSLSSFLSSLFSLLFLFFFSLPFSPPNTTARTDQPTRRPTSRHLNEIWRRASAQQSFLSLLPSLPPFLKKRKLFITGIFPARELF